MYQNLPYIKLYHFSHRTSLL